MTTPSQPPSSQANTFPCASITRRAAAALVDNALTAMANSGIEAAVAVTDAAGYLKAFERTDKAPFITVEVAINKAWTAASSGMATHHWNAMLTTQPETAQLANVARLMPVAGGYPIMAGGLLVGGIGISGGNAVQDRDVAEAALKASGFDVSA